jgi:hypothetical protein
MTAHAKRNVAQTEEKHCTNRRETLHKQKNCTEKNCKRKNSKQNKDKTRVEKHCEPGAGSRREPGAEERFD